MVLLLIFVLAIAALYCVRAGYRQARNAASQALVNWANGVRPSSKWGRRIGVATGGFTVAAGHGLAAFVRGARDGWPEGMDRGAKLAEKWGWVETAEEAQSRARHAANVRDGRREERERRYTERQLAEREARRQKRQSADPEPMEEGPEPAPPEPAAPIPSVAPRSEPLFRCYVCQAATSGEPTCADCRLSAQLRRDFPEDYCTRCGRVHTAKSTNGLCPACANPTTETPKEGTAMTTEVTVQTLLAYATQRAEEGSSEVDDARAASERADARRTEATNQIDGAIGAEFSADVTGPLMEIADADQKVVEATEALRLAQEAALEAAQQCVDALGLHSSITDAASGLSGGEESMAARGAYVDA